MDATELRAEPRHILGKKVNRLRRAGIVPADLYGHGIESQAIQVSAKELEHILARMEGAKLVSLKLDGAGQRLALLKAVQRHPWNGSILHVEFQQVSMREKIRATVPLRFTGEAPAVHNLGGTLLHALTEVEVECLPTDLPEAIEVDLSRLVDFDVAIHVSDLPTPPGVTLLEKEDELVTKVLPPAVEEEEAVQAAVAVAEEAARTAAQEAEEAASEQRQRAT